MATYQELCPLKSHSFTKYLKYKEEVRKRILKGLCLILSEYFVLNENLIIITKKDIDCLIVRREGSNWDFISKLGLFHLFQFQAFRGMLEDKG